MSLIPIVDFPYQQVLSLFYGQSSHIKLKETLINPLQKVLPLSLALVPH